MAIDDGLFSLLLEASATALCGVLRRSFALSKWTLSEIRLPASIKPKCSRDAQYASLQSAFSRFGEMDDCKRLLLVR